MFRFLKRQTPENQLLIQELERFQEGYRGPGIFDELVTKSAVQEILTTVKNDRSFSKETISRGGWAAREAAYLLISEFVASVLQSGRFHVYKGALNDEGKAYFRLYKACLGGLMKSGRFSDQEGVEQLLDMERLIAESG